MDSFNAIVQNNTFKLFISLESMCPDFGNIFRNNKVSYQFSIKI